MSIQAIMPKKFIGKIDDLIIIIKQIFTRFINVGKPKIFFRYATRLTHPTFLRYYENPPINWANFYSFDIAHWINYPAIINKKPFIIEVNDHPLSIISYSQPGFKQPVEVISHLRDAKQIYENNLCKIILITHGFEHLFHYYFGDIFDHKLSYIHSPGCIPKLSPSINQENQPVIFACLASDYVLKGVDLVIDAWLSLNNISNAQLILACPNIPESRIQEINANQNIKIIKTAPLSDLEKHDILKQASVTIAPTHVHGGGNIIEGMEYGHAIIYFKSHTTDFQSVGDEISVPYHFYLPSAYGVEWKTIDEFKERLLIDKAAGKFLLTKYELIKCMEKLINNNPYLNQRRAHVFELAKTSFSLNARNETLRKLYKELTDI